MFVARFPDFTKDIVILDLCAAPGGKSTLFLSRMSEGSILFSNEMVHKRAEILYENLVKWGSPQVVQTYNTALDYKIFSNSFDVVLIDAPCSGEGLFRKSPKYIQEWRENKSAQSANVQKELLEAAFDLVKEQGILIYSTCTFSPRENEDIVKWFNSKFKGMVEPIKPNMEQGWGIVEELIPQERGNDQKIYKFYPHKLKGEGFFTTAFKKTRGAGSVDFFRQKKFTSFKDAGNQIKAEVEKFSTIAENYKMVIKDEEVYIIPGRYFHFISSAFEKLNVMKAGTFAGTFNKKNGYFIPSHELAMSPFLRNDLPALDLDERNALRFLKKEDLLNIQADQLQNGWLLAKYQGLALGWLKKSDKRLNNFYPKDWKIRKNIDEFQ